MDKNGLDALRERISAIDRKMVALFEERMQAARDIGAYKNRHGMAVLDPHREKQVMQANLSLLEDAALEEYLEDFTRNLMRISRNYQQAGQEKVLRVGYQGTGGSYGEAAAMVLFGESTPRVQMESFERVFEAVRNQEIDQGVVPVENSSTGGLNDVFDLLRENDLFITGETRVKIDHCLLGLPESRMEDIREVHSHPQALKQCMGFFKNHPGIEGKEHTNTATAARDILRWKDPGKAAIASKRAAELLGLQVLAENIQDWDRNSTRFISVGQTMSDAAEAQKTSILFTTRHVPGALYLILKPLYEHNINISKIESRPDTRKTFEYYFYIDLEGSVMDRKMEKALAQVRANCGFFRVLGSYRSKGEDI
ncbi:MAG: prephenate dehydratase [Clostridia bacterium]